MRRRNLPSNKQKDCRPNRIVFKTKEEQLGNRMPESRYCAFRKMLTRETRKAEKYQNRLEVIRKRKELLSENESVQEYITLDEEARRIYNYLPLLETDIKRLKKHCNHLGLFMISDANPDFLICRCLSGCPEEIWIKKDQLLPNILNLNYSSNVPFEAAAEYFQREMQEYDISFFAGIQDLDEESFFAVTTHAENYDPEGYANKVIKQLSNCELGEITNTNVKVEQPKRKIKVLIKKG